MRRRLPAILLAALVAGCGVSDQDEVEIVDQPAPPSSTPTVSGDFPTPRTPTPPPLTPAPSATPPAG